MLSLPRIDWEVLPQLESVSWILGDPQEGQIRDLFSGFVRKFNAVGGNIHCHMQQGLDEAHVIS